MILVDLRVVADTISAPSRSSLPARIHIPRMLQCDGQQPIAAFCEELLSDNSEMPHQEDHTSLPSRLHIRTWPMTD